MKNLLLTFTIALTASSGIFNIPEEPFSYTYEIVSNSRNPSDMVDLYYYKERLIDTYEAYFMNLDVGMIGERVKENISLFKFNDSARVYYISGTIVVLLGSSKGYVVKGNLRSNECDTTVIREKFYIFDLFS